MQFIFANRKHKVFTWRWNSHHLPQGQHSTNKEKSWSRGSSQSRTRIFGIESYRCNWRSARNMPWSSVSASTDENKERYCEIKAMATTIRFTETRSTIPFLEWHENVYFHLKLHFYEIFLLRLKPWDFFPLSAIKLICKNEVTIYQVSFVMSALGTNEVWGYLALWKFCITILASLCYLFSLTSFCVSQRKHEN